MTKKNWIGTAVLCGILAPGMALFGQGPAQNINPGKHPNLAAAQRSISHAYQKIDQAQGANRDRLGGHGEKAKDLLARASQELKLAAEFANHRR